MSELTLAIAALAGIGSFAAPCILPMIPAFLAYISGTTITELAQPGTGRNRGDGTNVSAGSGGASAVSINRTNIVLNSAFFVLGFSAVFSILGVLINGVLPQHTGQLVETLNQVGGIIIISFGAFLLLSLKIRQLNIERKFLPGAGTRGWISGIGGAKARYPLSFVFGLAFAVGWTPCVGPILGTILTLAATTPSAAFNLLLAYSLGLGIPFILMGVFYSRATRMIRAMSRHLKYYNPILGGFIILLGVLVLTNQLAQIANFPLLNELLFLG